MNGTNGTAAIESSNFSQAGKDRSDQLRAEAIGQGFAPAQPVYAAGTRVVQLGVDNARRARQEFDAMPHAAVALAGLLQKVQAEERSDYVVADVTDIRMSRSTGKVKAGLEENAPVFALEPYGLRGILERSGIGRGASYLIDGCDKDLRASNFNYQMTHLIESGQTSAKLRTRKSPDGSRSVFGVVSEKYADLDADQIAAAMRAAVPEDAKAIVDYDGSKMRATVLFHSTVQPEQFVAGEFFRAGAIVRSADDGSGSIRVSAVVWQNLCLNLIIVDEAIVKIANIRHQGSTEKLRRRFVEAFAKAMKAIEPFRKAWDEATKDVVELKGAPLSKALPGIFQALIEDGRLPAPRNHVERLVAAHQADDSSAVALGTVTRASVANAITRYAHEANEDHWKEDALQAAAGKLLAERRPLRLIDVVMVDGTVQRMTTADATASGINVGKTVVDELLNGDA